MLAHLTYIPRVIEHMLTDGVVVLQPLATVDAAEWLAGEDDEQVRWFEFPRRSLLSDVQRFIDESQTSWRSGGDHRHWAIRWVESAPIVGGIDLRRLGDDEVNLSCVVFAPHRRQGVAGRASLLALRYAAKVLGATTALIKLLPGNVPSRRLAEGLGATLIGTAPSDAGATHLVYRVALQDLAQRRQPGE